jgi:hypothetical protein
MNSWFNLFIQVAKPVLATLVYTGTNSILNSLQEELETKQKLNTKLALNSWGIEAENSQEIYQKIQTVASLFALDESDENPQYLRREGNSKSYLTMPTEQTLAQLAQQVQQTSLKLPEIEKILEYWPLRLLPSQLLETCHPQGCQPLRIFLAPPKVAFEGWEKVGLETEEIEQRLAQGLREFLSQNYPFHSAVRATEFLGGIGNRQRFYGEASIKTIFSFLKSSPTLIIETEIVGKFLNLRLAYWGFKQEKYCYKTILKLPYQELIKESIKIRALKWQETRAKLEALGKTPAEIQQLGGNNAHNLAILQEAEALEAAGIDIEELNLPYQPNRQDFAALCQFLSLCHCLIAGWMADIHYLIEADVPPYLPQWLPELGKEVGDGEGLSAILPMTVSLYQGVLQALASDSPASIPYLALKLAYSLKDLPDKSLAKEQINYSLQTWLQQRQLPSLEDWQVLEGATVSLSEADGHYLESLQACLSALGDELAVNRVQRLWQGWQGKTGSNQQDKGEIAIFPSPLSPLRQEGKFSLDWTFAGVKGKVSSLATAPDGHKLISETAPNTLELWHLDRNQGQLSPHRQLRGHSGKILTVSVSCDAQTLASSDNTPNRSYIKIWNLETGKLHRSLFGHKQAIHCLAISPAQNSSNSPFLASGSHKIKLWDMKTGESFLTLFGHKEGVYSLAISADGKILVSGSKDKTVRVWNLRTGDLIHNLRGHQGTIKAITLHPDGRTIISGSEDKTIKLWDLKTGKLLHTLTGHSGTVQALAINSNQQQLISGSGDKTLKIWQIDRGELVQTLPGHQASVSAIAISSDGQTLASGSTDKTIKLWRAS